MLGSNLSNKCQDQHFSVSSYRDYVLIVWCKSYTANTILVPREDSHAGHALDVPDPDTWQTTTLSSHQISPILRPSNTGDGFLVRVDDVLLLLCITVV